VDKSLIQKYQVEKDLYTWKYSCWSRFIYKCLFRQYYRQKM